MLPARFRLSGADIVEGYASGFGTAAASHGVAAVVTLLVATRRADTARRDPAQGSFFLIGDGAAKAFLGAPPLNHALVGRWIGHLFGKKSQRGGPRSRTAGPATFAMVEGR